MEHLDFRPVLLAWAELQAEQMGQKKCARKGVGGMIRKLRGHLESPAVELYRRDTLRSVQLLESHCRLCGKCREATMAEAAE
jgi:hypothetical protein